MTSPIDDVVIGQVIRGNDALVSFGQVTKFGGDLHAAANGESREASSRCSTRQSNQLHHITPQHRYLLTPLTFGTNSVVGDEVESLADIGGSRIRVSRRLAGEAKFSRQIRL